jgi:alkanesulfonate monooxygenase SsuD/methylene tetrahydromethanopterin reductase-like flavin-dependent oxidoreductase (luciferase family)
VTRCAIDIAPLGTLSDPRAILRLAIAAEQAGWDGLSMWDSLVPESAPFAAGLFETLAAVAARTTRLTLITSIVALARRRPQLVIQSAATLDLLSEGRLVLGVGAGEDEPDFQPFGESHARATRIARMDEAVTIVDTGLRGEVLAHHGRHLVAENVTVGPRPFQQPRPPIWFGALRPAGLRRAARWDGWIAVALGPEPGTVLVTPGDLAAGLERVTAERRDLGLAEQPYEVAVLGTSATRRPGRAEYLAAGATWWLESLSPSRGTLAELEAIVRAGPPA